MSLYIGNKRVVSNIGSHFIINRKSATDWIGCVIGSQDLDQTDWNKLTNIRQYAFTQDYNLTNLHLPNCLTVGNNAFENSSVLAVDLPNCTSLNSYSFRNCSSLRNINIPNVNVISSYAFENCTNLQSIDIPSVTYLYGYCFARCSNLQSVDIPNTTKEIGYCVFREDTKLKKVWLPSTVKNMPYGMSDAPFYAVNDKCVIYTDIEDESHIPSNWNSYWNCYTSDYTKRLVVIYGATHQNFIDGTLPTFPYRLTVNAPQDCVVKITYMNVEQTTNTITMKEGGIATYSVEKEGYLPYKVNVTMGTEDISVTVSSSDLVKMPESLDITYDNATVGDNVVILSTLLDGSNFELDSVNRSIVNGPKTHYVSATVESHGYIVVRPKVNTTIEVKARVSSEQGWDFGGIYVDNKIVEPTWEQVRNNINPSTGRYMFRISGSDWTQRTYSMDLNANTTYYLNFFYVKDGGSVGEDKIFFDSIYIETPVELDKFEQVISGEVTEVDNSDVDNIPSNMFRGCNLLESVNLPNVTVCNEYGFSSCDSLNSLNLNNLSILEDSCLSDNTSLTELDLPMATKLGTNALTGCSSLRKLWLSDKCTTINASNIYSAPFRNDTLLTLYTNLTSAPSGWGEYWDCVDNQGTKINVIWGATHEQFENA